jgi:hypothetical protein
MLETKLNIQDVWNVCFYLSLGSVLISIKLILSHLLNFSQPVIQRKIVAIVWMSPIYAVTSYLSLRFVDKAMYFDMIRDCYESIVLYMFFALCYAYIGQANRDTLDYNRIYHVLRSKAEITHLWPFNRMLGAFDVRTQHPRIFLLKCKRNILQFVVVKPLMAILAIYLHKRGLYEPGNFALDQGYVYICLIVNYSISLSLYWLVLFYTATERALWPYDPVPKFLCIKGVLFFSFWQSVVIFILNRLNIIPSVELCGVTQNALICLEMFLATIAHAWAFSSKPFQLLVRPRVSTTRMLSNAFNLHDVIADFNEVSPLIVLPTTTTRQPPSTEVVESNIPVPSVNSLRLVTR